MRFAAVIALVLTVCLHAGAERRMCPGVVDTGTAKQQCADASWADPAGLWQIAGSQTILLIVRNNPGVEAVLPEYDVVMVRPEDSVRRTGEIVGSMRAAAKPGAYELRFAKSGSVTVEHNAADGTLTWGGTDRKHTRVRVNVFGLLPVLHRLLGVYIDPRRDSLKGMRKVFPTKNGTAVTDIIML